MSNIFAKLLEEGEKQHKQLQQQRVQTEEHQKVVFERSGNDSTTARQQSVKTARRHDSTTARQHDSAQDYLTAFLDMKATNKTTLRYPQSLMSELDEVIYQIKKTYGVTLSKNEFFVLALTHMLHDFKTNAAHSLVYKTLIEKKK